MTAGDMMARGTAGMTARDVLAALRRHHYRAAIVPELGIVDEWAFYDFNEDPLQTPPPVYTRRVDALMFEARIRTAIEIKVSRSDCKRESPNKVRPWRRVVHRYYYAVPAGLIDTPPVYGCGLWWVHPSGLVEVRRKTTINAAPEPLPQSVVQSLAFRAAQIRDPAPDLADLEAGA
jgi:hypothetical protein